VARSADHVIRYAYDARGRRTERTLSNGATTRYTYDAENALTAVEHDGHRLDFERDAVGREIRRSAGEGQVTIRSAYDAMDRLIDQRATAPSPMAGVPAALVQRRWEFDRGGRLSRVDDARWGAATYAHDRNDQLVGVALGEQREAFAYDPAGALVAALEGLGKPTEAWEILPGNRLSRTATAKYTYDARGRRTVKLELGGERGATEYAWDVRDRLREVKLPDGTRVQMRYDALGRRVRKVVQPAEPGGKSRVVDFVWDVNELATDIDSERGVRCFVHNPGTFLPLLQQERGEIFACVNDHLGVPRELLDMAGRVAWSATHSAWGRVTGTRADPVPRPASGSPFRMLGQVADEETGLCWTRFRCFDPEVGRWLSPDPIGVDGGLDLFGFNGSPARVVDPLGLAGKPHGANQLQQEVRRGQAPRDVERVDKPHVPGQQPHVHYTDGTSSNVDGTTHDAHRGQPNPSRATREWLESHNWTPPP